MIKHINSDLNYMTTYFTVITAIFRSNHPLYLFIQKRLQTDKAATKAMPVNRVGDFGLAPGIPGRF